MTETKISAAFSKTELQKLEAALNVSIQTEKELKNAVLTLLAFHNQRIMVNTPDGPIEARNMRDEEYPGIGLFFTKPETGEPGVILEYTSATHQVMLRYYSPERPDDDPTQEFKITQSDDAIRTAIIDFLMFEQATSAAYPFNVKPDKISPKQMEKLIRKCKMSINRETIYAACKDVLGKKEVSV